MRNSSCTRWSSLSTGFFLEAARGVWRCAVRCITTPWRRDCNYFSCCAPCERGCIFFFAVCSIFHILSSLRAGSEGPFAHQYHSAAGLPAGICTRSVKNIPPQERFMLLDRQDLL